MIKYLIPFLIFGSVFVKADTLPMQPHEILEKYKLKPVINSNEEMLKISLSETEFHMILDALKIASDSIQKDDPIYANKLRRLRYELLPDFEE